LKNYWNLNNQNFKNKIYSSLKMNFNKNRMILSKLLQNADKENRLGRF